MAKENNERWSVGRVERTWTSPKEYVILDGKKETIKLSSLEDAKAVCKLLNKVAPKKASTRKTKLKPKKTSAGDKKEEK